jgi:hypothetical protein
MGETVARYETGTLHMMRRLLVVALSIAVLLAAAILLIRAQQYDDTGLRALLTPPVGCPAPCFMGIQPEVTTAAEAVTILEGHPWVGAVDIRFNTNLREGELVWTWSGKQPQQIRSEAAGALRICDSLICSLAIPTRTPLGAIMLVFGAPDSGTLRSFPDTQRTFIVHTAVYGTLQFNVRTTGACPPAFTAMALQQNPTTIQMGVALDDVRPTSPTRPPRLQIVNFQNHAFAWLLRRGYVCGA